MTGGAGEPCRSQQISRDRAIHHTRHLRKRVRVGGKQEARRSPDSCPWWQGATFSGLTAGLYTYQLSGMTSANWNNVNSFQDNWMGTLLIPESSVVGVPEPGTPVLMALGLLALAVLGRRRMV